MGARERWARRWRDERSAASAERRRAQDYGRAPWPRPQGPARAGVAPFGVEVNLVFRHVLRLWNGVGFAGEKAWLWAWYRREKAEREKLQRIDPRVFRCRLPE